MYIYLYSCNMLQRIESFQFQTTSTRAYAHMRLSRPPLRGNDQRSTYRFDFDFSTNGKTLRRKFSSIVRKPIETSFPVFSLSVTVSRPVERARSKRQRRRDASIRHAATTTVVANAWWKKKKKIWKKKKKRKSRGKKRKKEKSTCPLSERTSRGRNTPSRSSVELVCRESERFD